MFGIEKSVMLKILTGRDLCSPFDKQVIHLSGT